MTRVLLFCATNRLEPETIAAIHGLQFEGVLDIMFTHDNPHGEYSAQNIIHNYHKAERITKAEGYDYLFTVENDIIPPPDALCKLLALDADIAYGVYCFRRGKPLINIVRHDDTMESYGLPGHIRQWGKVFGSVVPCSGLGLGCTLIKRRVLDIVPLHSASGGDADTQLALDARKAVLTQIADTSVLCGHKRPDGVIIWPTQDGYRLEGDAQPMKSRLIRPLRGMVYFHPVTDACQVMSEGQVYEVDFESAGTFVNVGFAEYA